MEPLPPSQRFITPEDGAGLFAMQVEHFPDLLAEVELLSDGKLGVVDAIVVTMGEAISLEPDATTDIARIREVLGVPEDPAQLPAWREELWDTFKYRSSAE